MKFPLSTIDIPQYYEKVKKLLLDDDCAIFIDTNIISQLYRLNDSARNDFFTWVESCGNRFHIPVWVIHEYSKKVPERLSEYLLELSDVKKIERDFSRISDFLKGYVGDSFLKGSVYNDNVDGLKEDVDKVNVALKKITSTINSNNISCHKEKVYNEIEKNLGNKIMDSNIYKILKDAEAEYQVRYENRVPPGFEDEDKKNNKIGDLIIWKEILEFCKSNEIKKAILITRDGKADIVYTPQNQTVEGRRAGETERVKIAKESLIYEFKKSVNSDNFYIIDFRTFVRIFASTYRELAISFQLATNKEKDDTINSNDDCFSNDDSINEFDNILNEILNRSDNEQIQQKTDDAHIKTEKTSNNYSQNAICDELYNADQGGCMDGTIRQLKTYNWYKQNPAIYALMSVKTVEQPENNKNRDSTFVLGRNIVQSAVGSSGGAISYVEKLSHYIFNWEPFFKKSLIDGMLFEVFFNSKGEIRPRGFKGLYFKEIISNIQQLGLDNPYNFINTKLSSVKERFVPIVGDSTIYNFKFTFNENGATQTITCNNKDISDTFYDDYSDIFSSKKNITSALMCYYGILDSNIQVDDIPDSIKSISYISQYEIVPGDEDLPF